MNYRQQVDFYTNALKQVDIHLSSNTKHVLQLKGNQLTDTYFLENGFNSPILVSDKRGLGLQVPKDIVKSLKEDLNSEYMIPVIKVISQSESIEWSVGKWLDYFLDIGIRDYVYNVISLEFSESKMAQLVIPPKFVKQLGWSYTIWPKTWEDQGIFPRTRLYCLMSIEGSFTQFHIDFGGSSVWYHVVKGAKVFYVAPPSEQNLKLYRKWCMNTKGLMSPLDGENWFLGYKLEDCCRIVIKAGDTFMLPTGWIHAVFTPVDSIAFGGNFIHGLNMKLQLECDRIDKDCKLDKQYRFPLYTALHWCAAAYYLRCFKKDSSMEQDLHGFLGHDIRKVAKCEKYGIPSLIKVLLNSLEQLKVAQVPLSVEDQKIKSTAMMLAQSMGYDTAHEMLNELNDRAKIPTISIKLPNPDEPLKLKFNSKVVEKAAQDIVWTINCKCGLKRNDEYDDGTRMISCDTCNVWQHTKCIGIKPDASPPLDFLCDACKKKALQTWQVNCSCGIVARDYDDGWRMVHCDGCLTWQHTECAGIPLSKSPSKSYRCKRCTKPKIDTTVSKKRNRTPSAKLVEQEKAANAADKIWTFEQEALGNIPAPPPQDDEPESVPLKKKAPKAVKPKLGRKIAKKHNTVRQRLMTKIGLKRR